MVYPSRGGGRRDTGDRSSGPKEMFDATCADCGQACQVPFKPGTDAEGKARPVYCRDCYAKHKKY